tara:strand:+ start:741 stop:1025 length:285 start_codon:yes stop_codon:yes gene_type:complete
MKDKDIRDQINDIIEADIQLGINDYIESKQAKEKEQGVGFVSPDEGKELKVNISQDQVDKILKEYKRIKKMEKSNLSQVKKMGLLDKNGRPIDS